jgi:hypothetical protein
LGQCADFDHIVFFERVSDPRDVFLIDIVGPPRGWPFFGYENATSFLDRGTIDKALRRPSGATQRRLEFAGYGSKDHVKSFRAPDYLLAERDALASAREQRALTGYFCGDPPPGYSALHGKTGLR